MTTPQGVRVCSAGADEVDAAADLLGRFRSWLGRSEPSVPQLAAAIRSVVDTSSHEFLLAKHDGRPVGVCVLTFRPTIWLTGSAVCCLEDLYVVDEARGLGAGRALVRGAVAVAEQRDCYRMELDVSSRNLAAKHFYESLGFTALETDFGGQNLILRLPLNSMSRPGAG